MQKTKPKTNRNTMTLEHIIIMNTPSAIVSVPNSMKLPLQHTRHGHSAGVSYELRVAAAFPTVGTRRHRASQNIPAPRSSSVFASGCVRIQSACPTGLPFLFNCNFPKFQCTAQPPPPQGRHHNATFATRCAFARCASGSLSDQYLHRQIDRKKMILGRPTELVTDKFA